jgi:hypothetical protein
MDDFEPIIEELRLLEEDGVPKNVKKSIEDIVIFLQDKNIERSTKISKALSVLDEIANDINLASHSRTQFWNLSSVLESMQS